MQSIGTKIDLEGLYLSSGALLDGHFLLSSGKHSRFYLQSAKIMECPSAVFSLASELSYMVSSSGVSVDYVCSPALGGIIVGYELARSLGVRFVFTERVNGVMELRRGFSIPKRAKVLVCEDVVTTGGSAMECARCVEVAGGNVVAFAALANRGSCVSVGSGSAVSSGCELPPGVPFFALHDFVFDVYDPDSCPLCKDSVAYKPGSRGNS